MYLSEKGPYAYFPVFYVQNGLERFLSLAARLQGDSVHADDIQEYIDFLMDLEEECSGDPLEMDEIFLKKYTHPSAVEARIKEAFSDGGGDRSEWEADCSGWETERSEWEAWQTEFTECAAGRKQMKLFLNKLNRYFAIFQKPKASLSLMAPGERICFVLEADMPEEKQRLLLQMIGWDILNANRAGKHISLTILEGAKKYDDELLELLGLLGAGINFNLFAEDFFAGHSQMWKEKVLAYFRRFVYTSHTSMASCEEISEKRFGKIQVVHTTRGHDHDQRISSFHLMDYLLGTDRVDHVMQTPPVEEPLYRKEDIKGMPEGTCLVQTERYEGYLSLR